MTQDDHMETITDRPHVVDVDEHGYHRCRDCGLVGGAPPDLPCSGTITDPALIRATDDPDERTTPAPVGDAVALDLDGARAMLNAANTIKATGGAVEIGGVRIEPCDEYGSTVTTARAEAAEAEVRRLTEESERLKRGGTELGRILDRALMMALDASGCHDVIEEDGDGDWEVVWETLAGLRPRAEAAEAEVVTLRAKLTALQVAVSHSAESCADGPCEFHETVARAESAEAKVAAVQALAEKRDVLYPPKFTFDAATNYVNGYRQARADFRAALAVTTGEGE